MTVPRSVPSGAGQRGFGLGSQSGDEFRCLWQVGDEIDGLAGHTGDGGMSPRATPAW